MIAQLARLRSRATAQIEQAFATTIRIDGGSDLPAARWMASTTAESEAAGLLPMADIAFRVRRELLADVALVPGRTTIQEGDRVFRFERVRDGNADPAVVLECRAV